MLQSQREERSRHFKLALRVGIPILLFVLVLAYAVFFREEPIHWTAEKVGYFAAMLFVIVYFLYFALELSRKETLLDRVTEGYHYDSFLTRVRRRKPQTLAAVKIDNLSAINENYGVGRADHLLKSLVEILNTSLLDTLDRHGSIGRKTGAELLLALDVEPERARKALENFVEKHRSIGGVEVKLVYAVIRNNIDDPAKALEQLRDLLISPLANSSVPSEKEVRISDAQKLSKEEKEVLEALEHQRMDLHLRPLLNLHTGRRDIYEISVKMMDSAGTGIPPRVFLPIINRHDLGERYDLLIFRRLLRLAPLVDASVAFTFNLSPYSLRKSTFREKLFSLQEASGVESRRFIIELYERRRHHRLEEYLEDLRKIKMRGFRLCLDNFGSSNASMEYLRHFPFDMIQFDREFTQEINNKKTVAVFRSFIAMAKEMEIITVAKWVDSPQQIQRLKELGIDYIQGYATGTIYNEEEFIRAYNPMKEV